ASVFSVGGGGASLGAGASLASRAGSFAVVSPISSEAMRPGGGRLNSGGGETGFGGGSGGGGSTTSCTAIGASSGGGAIGHSSSNSSGSRCSASDPIGPRQPTRSRSSTAAGRPGGSSRARPGDAKRGAPTGVGSRRPSSGD